MWGICQKFLSVEFSMTHPTPTWPLPTWPTHPTPPLEHFWEEHPWISWAASLCLPFGRQLWRHNVTYCRDLTYMETVFTDTIISDYRLIGVCRPPMYSTQPVFRNWHHLNTWIAKKLWRHYIMTSRLFRHYVMCSNCVNFWKQAVHWSLVFPDDPLRHQ